MLHYFKFPVVPSPLFDRRHSIAVCSWHQKNLGNYIFALNPFPQSDVTVCHDCLHLLQYGIQLHQVDGTGSGAVPMPFAAGAGCNIQPSSC